MQTVSKKQSTLTSWWFQPVWKISVNWIISVGLKITNIFHFPRRAAGWTSAAQDLGPKWWNLPRWRKTKSCSQPQHHPSQASTALRRSLRTGNAVQPTWQASIAEDGRILAVAHLTCMSFDHCWYSNLNHLLRVGKEKLSARMRGMLPSYHFPDTLATPGRLRVSIQST